MEATAQTDRERRLELARKAFKGFYAQCFWSSDPDLVVEERDIPLIIRNLRLHGGHEGFRLAAELCHWGEREVMRVLAACRHPDSFVAGGTVLHQAADSPRYSKDVDLFHDTSEAVQRAFETDQATLQAGGFNLVRWAAPNPDFIELSCGGGIIRRNSNGFMTVPSGSFRWSATWNLAGGSISGTQQ